MRITFALVLLTATLVFSGCKKCGEFEVKDGKQCVTWASLFERVWKLADDATCNGSPLVGNVDLQELNAPNLLRLDGDNGLQLTVISETVAEGGPYTLGDDNGTWTVRFRAEYHPAKSGSSAGQNNLGQITGTTPDTPESLTWSFWRNEGQNGSVGCSVSVY
ncbi:MAG: hypothetical protein JKX84_06925 [Flavobacteriales bacterium]|nr:hypothetical protein [Flavobacteriales bacterium]